MMMDHLRAFEMFFSRPLLVVCSKVTASPLLGDLSPCERVQHCSTNVNGGKVSRKYLSNCTYFHSPPFQRVSVSAGFSCLFVWAALLRSLSFHRKQTMWTVSSPKHRVHVCLLLRRTTGPSGWTNKKIGLWLDTHGPTQTQEAQAIEGGTQREPLGLIPQIQVASAKSYRLSPCFFPYYMKLNAADHL